MSDKKRKLEDGPINRDKSFLSRKKKRTEVVSNATDKQENEVLVSYQYMIDTLMRHDKFIDMMNYEDVMNIMKTSKNCFNNVVPILENNFLYGVVTAEQLFSLRYFHPKRVIFKLVFKNARTIGPLFEFPPFVIYANASKKIKTIGLLDPKRSTEEKLLVTLKGDNLRVFFMPLLINIGHMIKFINYPASLTTICFAQDFDDKVDALPDTIIHILFGERFNQTVDKLPAKLQSVGFRGIFNQSIDNLPPTTLKIYFLTMHINEGGFKRIIKKLPTSLNTLMIPINFMLDALAVVLPETLTHFYCNTRLKEEYLSSSLKYLVAENGLFDIRSPKLDNITHLCLNKNLIRDSVAVYPKNLKYIKIWTSNRLDITLDEKIPAHIKPINYGDLIPVDLLHDNDRVIDDGDNYKAWNSVINATIVKFLEMSDVDYFGRFYFRDLLCPTPTELENPDPFQF